MTMIKIEIIGNGIVTQKPARIGPAIQLQAIPNSGAVFIRWEGIGKFSSSSFSVCNVNPRYTPSVTAVFSGDESSQSSFDNRNNTAGDKNQPKPFEFDLVSKPTHLLTRSEIFQRYKLKQQQTKLSEKIRLEEAADNEAKLARDKIQRDSNLPVEISNKLNYPVSNDELLERFKQHQDKKKQLEKQNHNTRLTDGTENIGKTVIRPILATINQVIKSKIRYQDEITEQMTWIDDPSIEIVKKYDVDGRFIINDDSTVLDQATSLMWTYKVFPDKINMVDATAMKKSYASYSDWRIPTLLELKDIFPRGRSYFSTKASNFSWSSNEVAPGVYAAIDEAGRISSYDAKRRFLSLRLVRNVEGYPVKISVIGSGSGSVKSYLVAAKIDGDFGKVPRFSHQYPCGTKIELTAIPDVYSCFVKWSGDATGTGLSCLVNVDSPKAINAEFALITYPLIVSFKGSGEGVVTQEPQAIEYPKNAIVELEAKSLYRSSFAGWEGALRAANPKIKIVMDGPKCIVAEFVRHYPVVVGVNRSSMGKVVCNPDAAYVKDGGLVELSAIPTRGHRFVKWLGDMEGTSPNGSITVVGNTSVVAEFEVLTFSLQLLVEGSGRGDIVPSLNLESYPYGTSLTLTAIADAGSKFKKWSGDANGTKSEVLVTVDGSKTVVAEFVKVYSLTVSVQGKGLVKRSSMVNEFETGSIVNLTAIPEKGYEFVGWNDAAIGVKPVYTLVMNESIVIEAVFRPLPTFSLNVTHIGTGSGSVSLSQHELWKGRVVELTAKPVDGCIFDGWGGDISEGLDLVREVTINSNLNITAAFNRVEIPDADITLTFDEVRPVDVLNDNGLVFYFTITNLSGRQIHLEMPMAGFVTAQGEEIEQSSWANGMMNGGKGATLRAGTFRKVGFVFDRHYLKSVDLGAHLHISLLQRKPAKRLTFSFRCTRPFSLVMELVKADIESLAEEFDAHEVQGDLAAQAELTARIQLLEKSLQEALNRLNGSAPVQPHSITASSQSLLEVLNWLSAQTTVPISLLRQKLLPLGLMPSAVMDEVNERAFDIVGEPALEDVADIVTVQRDVLVQVLAAW